MDGSQMNAIGLIRDIDHNPTTPPPPPPGHTPKYHPDPHHQTPPVIVSRLTIGIPYPNIPCL